VTPWTEPSLVIRSRGSTFTWPREPTICKKQVIHHQTIQLKMFCHTSTTPFCLSNGKSCPRFTLASISTIRSNPALPGVSSFKRVNKLLWLEIDYRFFSWPVSAAGSCFHCGWPQHQPHPVSWPLARLLRFLRFHRQLIQLLWPAGTLPNPPDNFSVFDLTMISCCINWSRLTAPLAPCTSTCWPFLAWPL